MKITFLPFINGANKNEYGQNWRKNLENAFLTGEGSALTAQINQIRSAKNTYTDEQEYYKKLHDEKTKRQQLWLEKLISETANIIDAKIKTLKSASYDETIAAALPEFFWYDINDNNNNISKIAYYHKPIYGENLICLLNNENPLSKLTEKYANLIIFAGTVLWKCINPQKHEEEEIYNYLPVYHSGMITNFWGKHNISPIDGFNSIVDLSRVVKNKKGESTQTSSPVTEFKGKKFAMDICLDFAKGKNSSPLSTDLCKNTKTDVNVLIAAGMPVDAQSLSKINSPFLLRCDGLSTPYGEIADKTRSLSSVSTSADLFGHLEVNI